MEALHLLQPDTLQYIASQRVARLATADAQGRPHVVPVCFAFDSERFYIPLDSKPKSVAPTRLKRVRNIAGAIVLGAGRLVPLLTAHVSAHLGLYLYYGSRVAQPARVRAFIDLAVERVAGGRDWVLGAKELAAAARRADL